MDNIISNAIAPLSDWKHLSADELEALIRHIIRDELHEYDERKDTDRGENG